MKRTESDHPLRRFPESWVGFQPTALIVTAGLLFLNGCQGSKTRPAERRAESASRASRPSDADLIQAVRRSVEGKTYEVSSTRQEEQRHTCSQYDVDRDPYMPHNPELAKCPRVGATYSTWDAVPLREVRKCEPLPGPEYGWHVQSVGEERWRVTQSGSAWDVQELAGQSAKSSDHVEVSSFSFRINPHQPC